MINHQGFDQAPYRTILATTSGERKYLLNYFIFFNNRVRFLYCTIQNMNNLDPQIPFLLARCVYLEMAWVTELTGKQ